MVQPGTEQVYLCDYKEPLIHIIDPASDTCIDQIRRCEWSVMSPDGKRLFVSHVRGIERLRAQGVLAAYQRRRFEGSATAHDCMRLLRVIQHMQGSVTTIDLQTHQESSPIELSTIGGFLELTPDGKQFFAANLVIDTESMTVINSLEAGLGIGKHLLRRLSDQQERGHGKCWPHLSASSHRYPDSAQRDSPGIINRPHESVDLQQPERGSASWT